MDISGSMADSWSSPSTPKLTTAKTVLKSFVSMLRPDVGDQVGLATFPLVQSSSNYTEDCGGSYNQKYYGQIVKNLTGTSYTTVNTAIDGMSAVGGTPIADGMTKGLAIMTGAAVWPPTRRSSSCLGRYGNIEANGQWTGYQGNTSTGMGGCNGQAETDATNAAQAAKTAGVTVFTIAIGDSNVFSR